MRVLLIENDRLLEYYVEPATVDARAGNFYKGKVVNVLPGMQSAFVDIGLERNAFLHAEDCLNRSSRTERVNADRTIEQLLSPGQEMIVQIIKEPIGHKGPRVTMRYTLPGRYIVLMPFQPTIGISRKIENDEERNRFKTMMASFLDEGEGVIVRSAAEGASESELARDYRYLTSVLSDIVEKGSRAAAPNLLYKELSLLQRAIRDMFVDDVDELIVDSPSAYEALVETARSVMPTLCTRIRLTDGVDLLEELGMRESVEGIYVPKVWLKNGGYLYIDYTEALTVIDVNTGKYIGSVSLEETVYQTNLEAATEIAHQLRLRDIGGIVVIDFIDMLEEEHRNAVMQQLEHAVRDDRARTHIVGLSSLGLLELTRKKVRQPLHEIVQEPCSVCSGTGRVMAEHSITEALAAELRKYAANTDDEAILVEIHSRMAGALIGSKGRQLEKLEAWLGRQIYIKVQPALGASPFRIVCSGSNEKMKQLSLPLRAGQRLSLFVEERHAHRSNDGIARLQSYIIDIVGAGGSVGEVVNVEIVEVNKTYAVGGLIVI